MLRKKGFTLIELMIVVAIIAIIAAIAIPGLLRARISANEGAAIGTLRTIATSQAQFQSQGQVDQDSDGTGEYGLLGELAGTINRRAATGTNPKANPTFVTPVLGPQGTDPFGSKSGYRFVMYLPGTPIQDSGTDDGVSLDATAPGDKISIDAQETKWRCYAWPISTRTTGIRCFVADQAAEVLAAANLSGVSPLYDATTVPSFDAAIVNGATESSSLFENNIISGTTAADQQVWAPAGS